MVLPEQPAGLSDFVAHTFADGAPAMCIIDRQCVKEWWEYTQAQQRILDDLPSLLAELGCLRAQVRRTVFSEIVCGNERNEW